MPHASIKIQTLILAVLILAVIIFTGLLAGVPPVCRDGLTHHLFIPKLYLLHGGIYEIPHVSFSYYPMNLDLLYMIPLSFGNDIVPKFIHFAFALITAGLIYRYLSRRINVQYALLGALFFISIPIIVRLSSTVYVDLGLICFLFASLLYLFHWIESGFKPRHLFVSAVFCGLALGTKYNGLVGLFLLGLFVPFIYSRYNSDRKFYGIKAVCWCVSFVITALIVFSPWMIRNVVWTDNPVYPLHNSVFNRTDKPLETLSMDEEAESRSCMTRTQIRHEIYGDSYAEIALIPLRIFFQGKDDDPKYFDGKISPFLLLLPLFAFLRIRAGSRQEKTEKMLMLAFSILFLLFTFSKAAIRIRYFSPILPPLVVLSMFGLYNLQSAVLSRFSLPFKRTAVFGIVFVMLGMNALYMADRFRKNQPLAYISGKVTRDEYIQAFRPEFASFQYANENLDENAKILGFFIGNRGYYSDFYIEFSTNLLQKMAADAESGLKIAEKLRDRGFTHMIVNFPMFNNWARKYSHHEKNMLQKFFDSYTITEFSQDGYGLLSVTGEKEFTTSKMKEGGDV